MCDADAAKYCELFEAVHDNDLEKVKALCTPNGKGECVLVSCAGAKGLTPLALAANRGYKEMLHVLFQLVDRQYTPIPVMKTVSQGGKFSNYALVTGDVEEKEEFVDPNASAEEIINPCPPSVVLMEVSTFDMRKNQRYFSHPKQNRSCRYNFGCGSNGNEEDEDERTEQASLMEYLVYRGDKELFAAVMEDLHALSEKTFAKQLKANMVKEEERKEKSLLVRMFTTTAQNRWYSSK